MAETKPRWSRDPVQRMLADAVLPPDLEPAPGRARADARVALLTGATGFLGRHVARALLRDTDLRLICLARGVTEADAAVRVESALRSAGVAQQDLEQRVEVLQGDLAAPELGLGAAAFAALSTRIDLIHHCAARVDWVRGYGQLHAVNVGGAATLVRLACTGHRKRLVFVSSIAVCYARGGPDRVDETTDMLPYLEGMPLGYARSKCVAEALLRQAAARGVPVTVLRPALISGDAQTGAANASDLIAALLQGCSATGLAIDTDWLLDFVPVDFVARVAARVPQGSQHWQVLHLVHRRPRQWRELILWMNLHGYPVRLVDADTWIGQLFDQRRCRGTLLYGQRQFFRGRPGSTAVRPYESYLAPGQRRIDAARTRILLQRLGLHEPPLGTDLLHRYFAEYRRLGVLPAQPGGSPTKIPVERVLDGPWRSTGSDVPDFDPERLRQARIERIDSEDAILSEIASARVGDAVGLWRLDLTARAGGTAARPRQLVLKVKSGERELEALTVTLARLCRPALGRLFERFQRDLGLAGSTETELALYALDAPRLRRHLPRCYGLQRRVSDGRWALLLEYLPGTRDRALRQRLRDPAVVAPKLLETLSAIHAVGFGRGSSTADPRWAGAARNPERMLEMLPLWRELADFASPWFAHWCGPSLPRLHREILRGLETWWQRLQGLPTALVHNDFNPRNAVLHDRDGSTRLCVYDWELARRGVPQHDLAEWLCFSSPRALAPAHLDALLAGHREALAQATGVQIDAREWHEGFVLALRHLLIERLAMYTLVHRFRPLDYLPDVLRNWRHLYGWATGRGPF
ncbi:thioester reductase domain-containing protein [Thioalkalivibrio paradoxus]|nr:thioester reductase domain-containing protein [Thioalkalivibrio paradoxus]